MECTEEYIESAIKPIRTLLSDQKCIFEGFDSNTEWNLVISVVMLVFILLLWKFLKTFLEQNSRNSLKLNSSGLT